MQLAIQEDMLPGSTPLDKLRHAHDLKLDGVEFHVQDSFEDRIATISEAVRETGVKVSAINIGQTKLLHPEFVVRDAAIVAIRRAMTCAVDLGAQGVIFQAHHTPYPVLPDLTPYKSPQELEAELLITLLRTTLTDLAYALGTDLFLEPVNRQETHLVRRLEHAALVRRKLDDHPHIKIAANLYHMTMEGEDLAQSLRTHATDIGYLHIADDNRQLPGQGSIDFVSVIHALRDGGYNGWLCFECGTPGKNHDHADTFLQSLPASLAALYSASQT